MVTAKRAPVSYTTVFGFTMFYFGFTEFRICKPNALDDARLFPGFSCTKKIDFRRRHSGRTFFFFSRNRSESAARWRTSEDLRTRFFFFRFSERNSNETKPPPPPVRRLNHRRRSTPVACAFPARSYQPRNIRIRRDSSWFVVRDTCHAFTTGKTTGFPRDCLWYFNTDSAALDDTSTRQLG